MTTPTGGRGDARWAVLYLRPAQVLLWLNLGFAIMVFGGLALWVGPLAVTDPERALIRLSVYWELAALAIAASLTYAVGAWLERH